MYTRTITRKNKNGTEVSYLQLCENRWNREKKRSEVKIIYNLGRTDKLDYEKIESFIRSLETLLPEENRRHTNEEMLPLSSKTFGMTYLIEEVWKTLTFDKTIKALLKKRKYNLPIERVILGEVMNRAILPHSKKGTYEWIKEDTYLEGKDRISLQHMYRTMDFLIQNKEEIEENIYLTISTLFNSKPFIVFYDTTTTYFEIDEEDTLRKRGYSKDKRSDKPQIVLALAINSDGYPIKHWVFPGNTAEKEKIQFVIEEIRKMKGLLLENSGKDKNTHLNHNNKNTNKDYHNDTLPLIFVGDNGMMKLDALHFLEENNEKYIMATSLRTKQGEVLIEDHTTSYVPITLWNGLTLLVKEKVIDGRRYCLSYSKEQEAVDRKAREDIIRYIKEKMKGIKNKTNTKEILSLYTHKVYGKYLRRDKETQEIKLDEKAIEYDMMKDGKFLLVTNDLHTDVADIISGYKNLYTIERTFETMKSVLELRPIYHSKEERIKAHVFLCVLAYLLIHYIEVKTNMTYATVKREMEKLSLVEYKTKESVTFLQRTQLTDKQKEIMNKLDIKLPPTYLNIEITNKRQ